MYVYVCMHIYICMNVVPFIIKFLFFFDNLAQKKLYMCLGLRVKYSKKLGYLSGVLFFFFFFYHYFFSCKSIWNTETKSSQVSILTKKLNHLDRSH